MLVISWTSAKTFDASLPLPAKTGRLLARTSSMLHFSLLPELLKVRSTLLNISLSGISWFCCYTGIASSAILLLIWYHFWSQQKCGTVCCLLILYLSLPRSLVCSYSFVFPMGLLCLSVPPNLSNSQLCSLSYIWHIHMSSYNVGGSLCVSLASWTILVCPPNFVKKISFSGLMSFGDWSSRYG